VTFARLHVIPHLSTFLDQHPALEVEVMLDDGNIDLVEAGIDVSLRMGALVDSSLTARKITESPRVVVGTPSYFEKAGEPLTPADLSAHQAVIYGQRGGGGEWSFRRGKSEISVTLKGRVHVTAAEGVREAVFAGLGLAIGS
jgi:DNA-binding transcriptional LysR family regulator